MCTYMRSADAQAEAQEAFRELAGLDVGAEQVCYHLETPNLQPQGLDWKAFAHAIGQNERGAVIERLTPVL